MYPTQFFLITVFKEHEISSRVAFKVLKWAQPFSYNQSSAQFMVNLVKISEL